MVRVLKVATDPLKHLLRHLLVVLGWSLTKPEVMLFPATVNLSLAIFPSFSRVNDVVTLTYQVLVQSFPVRYRRLAYRTVQHRASLLVIRSRYGSTPLTVLLSFETFFSLVLVVFVFKMVRGRYRYHLPSKHVDCTTY